MTGWHVLAWGAWVLVTVCGAGLFMLRSTETGLSYVSLPRLLYFMWIMVCVLVLTAVRAPYEAAAMLAVALGVGVWAFLGDEPGDVRRLGELRERLEGCRRTLEREPRNPMSLELIGDVYSTLEEPSLARLYWDRAYAIMPQTKLREKLAGLERAVPAFYYWGGRCVAEARACPKCEAVSGRLDWACSGCGELAFPDRSSWAAARFNRFCDESGAGAAIETGVLLLPLLFLTAPWAYAAAWLAWIGARRPGPAEAR